MFFFSLLNEMYFFTCDTLFTIILFVHTMNLHIDNLSFLFVCGNLKKILEQKKKTKLNPFIYSYLLFDEIRTQKENILLPNFGSLVQ